MFPKLYKNNEANFNHNGLGLLTGSIKAVATEELNGMFELKIEYDNEGFLADLIKEEMIIKAKANDKQDEQLFRIYSITKNHDTDNLIIEAQHITYDLANNFVEKLEASNLSKRQVMESIGSSTAYPHPFNLTSPNMTTRSSTSLYRTNPLQMIGGMEGSILQIWGGQIERDNFNLIMHDRRGSNDGVKVLYKKNLIGLTAKFDIENLVTRIFPYVYIPATEDELEQLITVPGKYIDSPYINDYEMPYILPVDYSYEDGVETSQDLLNIASNWFAETGRDKPKVNMEVQFEHLWETEEYKDVAALELVGMGDTITVEHSKLKVEGTAIVNRIEYDVLAGKNIAVDVGAVKARFTDKVNNVVNVVDKVEEIEASTNQALKTANGKNTIYYGSDEPTGSHTEDDLWFRVVDGEYTRTYRFDGIQWQLVVSKDVADIETVANDAHNRANQAVATANLASQNAVEAINQAQDAFDDAQLALTTAQGLTNRMSSVEGDISTLSQTTQSFATRIENAEGDISTLIQTAQGLQTRVADAEDNITSVTQLATGMQTRLTNAEGSINTLTTTASSLDSTIKSVRDDLDGLEIGGKNYVTREILSNGIIEDGSGFLAISSDSYANYERGFKATGGNNGRKGYVEFTNVFKEKGTYTISFNFRGRQGSALRIKVSLGGQKSSDFISLSNDTYNDSAYTFTATISDTSEENNFIRFEGLEWKYYYFNDIKLEKGNKATDWTPAPEDMATQSQITQLSNNINLRVSKDDIINQINISTEDILISGKKLILDGDTTVTGTFRVSNANITSVDAGKMTTGELDAALVNIINLNASNIVSGTIDTNLLTIRGGSAIDYTMIDGSYLESRGRFSRTWRGITETHDIKLRFQNGYLRARNDSKNHSLYFTDFGISTYVDGDGGGLSSGTLAFRELEYGNSEGVTLHSTFGAVALKSEENRVVIDSGFSASVESRGASVYLRPMQEIRPGANEFRLWVKETNDASLADGVLSYGSANVTDHASGLRFKKTTVGDPIVWVTDGNGNIGTGTLDADVVRANNFTTRGGAYSVYFNGRGGGTLNSGEYLSAGGIKTNASDFFLGVPARTNGKFRVTNGNGYNNGNGIGYRPIVASAFENGSSITYKTNIKPLSVSALNIINELSIVEYNLIDDVENGRLDNRQVGLISEHSLSVANSDGMAIDLYKLTSYNTKAIQELDTKIYQTREDLVLKVAQLEQRINELESVA